MEIEIIIMNTEIDHDGACGVRYFLVIFDFCPGFGRPDRPSSGWKELGS
jgi:hypothetical protein